MIAPAILYPFYYLLILVMPIREREKTYHNQISKLHISIMTLDWGIISNIFEKFKNEYVMKCT